MKVVHIMTSVSNSSAGYRLHKALLKHKIDSSVLSAKKSSDLTNVEVINHSKIKLLINKSIEKLTLLNQNNILPFSSSLFGVNISKNKLVKEADIVHLHWINGGFLGFNSLMKLKNKKIVWTLHDSWPITGGCHVSLGCKEFENYCGFCPIIHSDKKKDISNKIIKKKIDIYKDLDLTIITPSDWMFNRASNSRVLKNKTIKKIPNTLNLSTFKVYKKNKVKYELNLKEEKKYILFGAINPTKTTYKGFDYLIKALKKLDYKNENNNIEIIVFGANKDYEYDIPFNIKFVGKINEEEILAKLYSSCDMLLYPSLDDNLPNVVLEALSCKLPVCAFDVGGINEMIEHKLNGYLAKYKDVDDLVTGINFCLKNKEKLNERTRSSIIEKFDSKKIAFEHKETYRNIIK